MDNMKPITFEEQIETLEARIREQDTIIKKLSKSPTGYNLKDGLMIFQTFNLLEEQALELAKYVKFTIYRNGGDMFMTLQDIENAPINIREKFFCVFYLVQFCNPNSPCPGDAIPIPGHAPKEFVDFMKKLFGGK